MCRPAGTGPCYARLLSAIELVLDLFTLPSLRITLLGMPGSGKGTHGPALSRRWAVPLIAIGDMLRARADLGDEIGREIASFQEEGVLVPDEVVAQALAERLVEPAARSGFILDGYPRRQDQGETLAIMLAAHEPPETLDLAIYLSIDQRTAVQRLAQRLVCSRCRAPTTTREAKRGGACPNCGGTVERRNDDKKKESVRRRIETFLEETAPLVAYYKARDLLAEVDATQSPKRVLADIEGAVHAVQRSGAR